MSDEQLAPEGGAGIIPDGGDDTGSIAPDYETVAREKGWRPKEEYEGEVEAWVGPEEFVKRQPLFDKIKTQSKKLKDLERTVEALSKHYSTNIAQAKERAIIDLKSERREAIEMGEVSKVEEIDQKIQHVSQMAEPVVPTKPLATEIETFVEDQKAWFNKDEEMTTFAVSYNESYLKKHPGDLGKSLEETLKAVRRAYPEKFENTRRSAPPTVEGSTPITKSTEKYGINRLTPEQKLVYQQLVKVHKQLTHEQYFKSLEDAGFLEK